MTDDVMILDTDMYAIFMDVFDTPDESDESLQEFLDELQQLHGEMLDALAADHFNYLQHNAHKAKNTAGTIGLVELSRLAMTIDNLCRAGSFAEARTAFETQWPDTFTRAVSAIDEIRQADH